MKRREPDFLKRKSKRLYAMRNSMAGESPLAAHMLRVKFFAPITMTNAAAMSSASPIYGAHPRLRVTMRDRSCEWSTTVFDTSEWPQTRPRIESLNVGIRVHA